MMTHDPALATFRHLPPDKQERVLDAALSEFADQGYHQASLNRVVARAGIAKGSLYQYFPNKEGIFQHLFNYALGLVRRTLTQVKDGTLEENFFVRLEKSLLAWVRFFREHPRVFNLYLKIQFDKNVPFREEFLSAIRRHAGEYFASLLRRAHGRGELRPGVSPQAATFLLDAVFDRFLQAVAVPAMDVTLGLHQATDAEVQRRGREIIGLLREGLAA